MADDRIDFGSFTVNVDLDRWPAKILRALLRRHYERNERHLLPSLLRPDDTVVELGSAIGVVAMAASRVVPPQRIFCFDANPLMVEEARRNFAANGKQISVDNRVLTADRVLDAPTSATFFQTPYFLSSSLIRHRDDMVAVEVPCSRLETTLEECGANVAIIDIEGGEFSLLPAVCLDKIDRISVEIHLSHGSLADCLALIDGLAAQGLALDARHTSENVFVFSRECTPTAGFAEAYLGALDTARTGDRRAAASCMAAACALVPDNASARMQRADLALILGEPEAALAASIAAIDADPNDPDAFQQHAELQDVAGDPAAAADAIARAVDLDPCRPLFHAAQAVLRARAGDDAGAVDALRRAAALVPDRARGFATLAALTTRQDKFDADMASASLTDGDAAWRSDLLARLAKRVQAGFKLKLAGSALDTALAIVPDDQGLHVALAHLTATPADLRKVF